MKSLDVLNARKLKIEQDLEDYRKSHTKDFKNILRKGCHSRDVDEWNKLNREYFNVQTNINQLKMRMLNH